MKVTRRYNQHRRDLDIDLECEACGTGVTTRAYDDTNFWRNVVPSMPCPACELSAIDQGLTPTDTHTRYPEGMTV